MLTDQQLTETAIRIVLGELNNLGTYHRDSVGEALCQDHCTDDTCGHDPIESVQEVSAVQAELKNAVNTLRVHLRDYAAARQINLNIGEALV